MLKDQYAAYVGGAFQHTTYGQWLRAEGVAVYEDWFVSNVWDLERKAWPRLGVNAVFITLYPMMEGQRGMYFAEIPPGRSTEPIRHLYEQMICILEGEGTTEVWQEGEQAGLATGRGQAGPGAGGESQAPGPLMAVGPADTLSAASPARHVFEWGRGSLFSPPLNTWYRMYNLGQDPVRFLTINRAPAAMNEFQSADFVFNCPYAFRDRYDGREGYFSVAPKDLTDARGLWLTNFIPSAIGAELDSGEYKASGGGLTGFRMAGNQMVSHISEWPVGRYHKAHYHGAGALLLGLRSEGYVLLWSSQLGTQPYSEGRGDEVIEVPWGRGSLYSPPSEWFHQHFNTGKEPARHLAIRGGNSFSGALLGSSTSDFNAATTDIREGGTLLEYEAEDPEVRRRYQEELRRQGVPFQMPEELYRPGYVRAQRSSPEKRS